MNDKKVVSLGGRKKGLEDELLEIAKIITDDTGNDPPENNDKSTIYINGSGNVVGQGNFVNHGVVNINKTARRTVNVKTGDGVVNATQKHQIKSLLYEWVDTHNSIKKAQISYGLAWSKLNSFLKVNSYHEIASGDFDKAIKYIRQKLGELRNMASAPKKVSNWRAQTIKSIQARCSERGWQEWRKTYMSKTFMKSSMTELTDEELQKLYQTIWSKR
ncbi:TPA: hypothetical protein ACGQTK_002964 [Klebsiella quasipneumoniae]|nr:hypothetical protein [Klebsiella pneumoniae]HBS7138336.1 hypothetical protein [Klebsiella pneumoniae]